MANKTVKKIEATKPALSAQYSTFTRKRKVAAYARVSTAKEEQENSFEPVDEPSGFKRRGKIKLYQCHSDYAQRYGSNDTNCYRTF